MHRLRDIESAEMNIELINQLERTLQEIFTQYPGPRTLKRLLTDVRYQYNFIRKKHAEKRNPKPPQMSHGPNPLPVYTLKKNGRAHALYIKSPHWQRCRKLALERDNYMCQVCGYESMVGLHVHHLNYKNKGNEHNHLEDLVTLCKDCHGDMHKKKMK